MEKSSDLRESKLYYFLSGLEMSEREQFQRYLEAGIFGVPRGMPDFFQDFRDQVLEAGHGPVDKERFCQDIHCTRTQLEHRMNTLLKTLYQYFSIVNLRNNESLQQICLLRECAERRRMHYFDGEYLKSVKRLSMGDQGDYYVATELEKIRQSHLLSSLPRNKDRLVQPVLKAIDLQHAMQKLKYACAALNQDRIVDSSHQLEHMDAVTAFVDAHSGTMPALVMAYYHLYHAFCASGKADHVRRFREILKDEKNGIGLSELKELEQYWYNHCARMINTGRTEYLRILRDAYEVGLETGRLLDESGQISPETYKNIALIVLRTTPWASTDPEQAQLRSDAIEWAKRFTGKYVHHLPTRWRDRAYRFNLAMIHFYQGEFSAAIREINDVLSGNNDIFYNLDGRMLMVRSYLELGEWMPLESLIIAFRRDIQRNKRIPQERKEILRETLRFTNGLALALQQPEPRRKKKLEKIQREIMKSGNARKMTWLTAMVARYLADYP